MIAPGCTVARVGDTSGRTRKVKHVTTDADGKSFATLDEFLDGWLIWNTDELRLVKAPRTRTVRKGKPYHARRALFSRRT